jgi:hypothetical protein
MTLHRALHTVGDMAAPFSGCGRMLGGKFSWRNAMTTKPLTPPKRGAPGGAPLARRGLLLGAGAAGAAVVAARAIPGGAATEVAQAAAEPALDSAAGYQLTPHVLRYYETTKV